MIKFQNIIILFLIALTAVFFVFNEEIVDLLKLKMQDNVFYSSVEPPPLATGLFVGDIMLSRGVAYQIEKNNNLNYPFLNVSDFLKGGDFVFGNLEAPIINGPKIKAGEMIFRVDENLVPILKDYNFSIFSLANNHILNFGEKGLENTFHLLDQAGIQYVGAGKNFSEAHQAKIIEKNNIKFAFLAYVDKALAYPSAMASDHPGLSIMDEGQVTLDVQQAKKLADFVIVSTHSGNEYQTEPTRNQINFAHAAIDAGADLVIGHHPHVIQPIEKYKNGYIFYSLGNFIFDQMWSQATQEGIALRIIFSPRSIKTIQIYPLVIENYSQPKIINASSSPEHFQNIIKKINLPDNKLVIVQK